VLLLRRAGAPGFSGHQSKALWELAGGPSLEPAELARGYFAALSLKQKLQELDRFPRESVFRRRQRYQGTSKTEFENRYY